MSSGLVGVELGARLWPILAWLVNSARSWLPHDAPDHSGIWSRIRQHHACHHLRTNSEQGLLGCRQAGARGHDVVDQDHQLPTQARSGLKVIR